MKLSDEIVVILTGGEGRRMGFADKGTLLIDGERLIDRLTKQILADKMNAIISGSHNYGLQLPFVPDLDGGIKGPVGGLFAALAWIKEFRPHATGFFSVPVDCPTLPKDLFQRLYSPDKSCIACDESGTHPVFGWWRVDDLTTLKDDLNANVSISMHHVVEMIRAECIEWPDDDQFVNINTKEQLQKYSQS